MSQRLLGVTVLPEYVQSESIESVLDRLQAAGVTDIATSPYVMAVADEESGNREPPIDAGAGSVRLLDRPLWGARELWVRTSPSFTPDRSLYAGLPYQPPLPDALTESEGAIVSEFIAAAQRRQMRVVFQVQAAIPPGYRVQFGGPLEEDAPRMADGRVPQRRVANNASLASPAIRAYQRAMIIDLCRQYPTLDGLRFDWPEYPPYRLDSVFVDFSESAKQAAARLGYDFAAMQRDLQAIYTSLHGGLTTERLQQWTASFSDADAALSALAKDREGVRQWLSFKSDLSGELLAGFRDAANEAGRDDRFQISATAFPPPWSYVSGMDYRKVAPRVDAVHVKLYGMHWSMMLRFYAEQLLESNPGLDSRLLVNALESLLDICDEPTDGRLEEYRYPEPDEPHLAGSEAQRRKIETARQLGRDTQVWALAHGYGPLDDFARRFQVARQAGADGIWLNRYGYLSDEKLRVMAEGMSG